MKKRRYVETESVEEFLARGGEIQTEYKLPTEPLQVMGDYSNKEFEQKLHGFYNSKEWKIAKNKVKLELAPFCPVCGSEENLHVDHIQPIRYFFDLRLDHNNLQILCKDCNQEKGSMLNWNLEWHIKHKKQLILERQQKTLELIRYNQRKGKEFRANKGLIQREIDALDALYMSYVSICRSKGHQPCTKYDLKIHIQNNIKDDPWNKDNVNAIKRYLKTNYDKVETIQTKTKYKAV